ncbi:MAG: hypothetical protein K2X81_26880 [Candidatus Obscuribacterales bacterium]|nr:hypothetical protein [Candidatus Obscuribacterales bacterium]
MWHESTSDAVLQDALPNSGRMFIFYYKQGDPQSERQQRYIEDVARNWGDYVSNTVRFYKIDVDADVTTSTHAGRTPLMLMVVPSSNGQLKILNSAAGALTHEEVYDFFQAAMKNPANTNVKAQCRKVTADEVLPLMQRSGLPVVTLYYDSSSLLSAVQEVYFEQLAALYSNEMSFVKIDLIQDEEDSNSLGGIPCIAVYSLEEDGCITMNKMQNGFCTLTELLQIFAH